MLRKSRICVHLCAPALLIAALAMPANARVPDSEPHGVPGLYLEPIAGLTTTRHPAPALTAVPRGARLTFCVDAQTTIPLDSPAGIVWEGAREVRTDGTLSFARYTAGSLGQHTVTAKVVGEAGQTYFEFDSVIDVLDITVDDINVSPINASVSPFVLDESASNMETMGYYFGESIAPLQRHPNGTADYLTSVDRTVTFNVQVEPAYMTPLLEWRVGGKAVLLGNTFERSFGKTQTHAISVGPTSKEARLDIEVYRAKIIGPNNIVEDEPVTFHVETEPPGFEDHVVWLSSTKFGAAYPVLGQGESFTATFEQTAGPHPDENFFQWLGVRASNAVQGQDQKVEGCCGEGVDIFSTNTNIPSFIQFGTADIPAVPADFFGPGSDPFVGVVEWMGNPLAQPDFGSTMVQCGTTDTKVRRLGPVVCPGSGFPRPCDPVAVEMVNLSLSSVQPITVTFNGGQNPEQWSVAMAATQNQGLGTLNATLENPTGGTHTAELPVTVTVAFVRVDAVLNGPFDPDNDIKQFDGVTVDMGWPVPVPWSRIPPNNGGFFCEPQGFDVPEPFFPGEAANFDADQAAGCATCQQCSGAGCHGGPNHAHCICQPIPCPNRCTMSSLQGFKFPFPICLGVNTAPLGTINTMVPCDPGLPDGFCCGSPPVPPVIIGLFPCSAGGLSLQVYVNSVMCQ